MELYAQWIALVMICLASYCNMLEESNEVDPKCGMGCGTGAENEKLTLFGDEDSELRKLHRPVRQVVERTITKPSYCIEQTEYDPCIDEDLIAGYCSCDRTTSTISVSRGIPTNESDEYYVEYCLEQFENLGFYRYKTLQLSGSTNLALKADLLGDMMFDQVELSGSKIKNLDKTFLGKSENVTRVLIMSSIMSNEVPAIKSNCLDTLEMTFESTEVLKLRSSSTRHLQTVQNLTIETESGTVSVGRGTFREMDSLKHLSLGNGVKLNFGSLAFGPKSNLVDISLGALLEAQPGSIASLPGVKLIIRDFTASISPVVWFNFFSTGGTVQVTGVGGSSGLPCERCGFKWIHRGFRREGGLIKCTWFFNHAGGIVPLSSLPDDYYSHCT